MAIKSTLLIDGGYLRTIATNAGHTYNPDFIESFSHVRDRDDEVLQRVVYYDCPQYRGRQRKPVSGSFQQFTASDKWLEDLARRELFAVRRGTLAFRGWALRSIPMQGGGPPSDADFRPNSSKRAWI